MPGGPDIIVEVDPDGNSVVTAPGFKGRACTEATKELIAALGTKTSEKKTPDFYQPDFEPVKKKVKVKSA